MSQNVDFLGRRPLNYLSLSFSNYMFGMIFYPLTCLELAGIMTEEAVEKTICSGSDGYTVRVSAALITSWYVMLEKSSNWLIVSSPFVTLGIELRKCFRSSSRSS